MKDSAENNLDERQFEIIATSTFGLEAVVKREIETLGYEITDSRNGRLTYKGDLRALVRSNLWLRCADRVYVKMGEFTAKTFDELFRAAESLPWEDWLPVNAHFSEQHIMPPVLLRHRFDLFGSLFLFAK